MDIINTIKYHLQTLRPKFVDLTDESYLHIGHAGKKNGGHYKLIIVSEQFNNINRLNRQKMVYQLLQNLFNKEIHALSIKALTPNEFLKLNH